MTNSTWTVHLVLLAFLITAVAGATLTATKPSEAVQYSQSPTQQRLSAHSRHHHGPYSQRQHTYPSNRPIRRPRKEQSPHPDTEVETLPGSVAANNNKLNSTSSLAQTTRLRRVNSRDFYNYNTNNNNNNNNNGISQRANNDWGYHSYNVHSNSYGTPSWSRTGKGDDNTQDVEFIDSKGRANTANTPPVLPDWARPSLTPRRGVTPSGSSASPPPPPAPPVMRRAVTSVPPLVPARRGYATLPTDAPNHIMPIAPTTEDPFETNTISRGGASPSATPMDAKDMERRHICVQQRTVTTPVKTTEIYTRPIWKHVNTPCQPPTYPNQMCTRVQLVHEQAYRDVIRHKASQQLAYDCCQGWTRETPQADACMKPVCSSRCQNGGTCSGADTCSCPKGFTGRLCEEDVNECAEDKPCDQTCVNTHGSYRCQCRSGFILQTDQQSCKKLDTHRDDAFEARDLENDIDSGDGMGARLHRLERSLANERVHTNELQKSLQATYTVVDTLKSRLSTLEKQQQDINRLQTNLYATQSRTNRLEGLINHLMKCQNAPNADCP